MAITNAQQYKQLLAKGGRIGLRNGSYDSPSSSTQQQESYESAAYDPGPNSPPSVNKSTAPAVSYSGSGDDGSYDFVEQKFVLTPEDRTIITSGGGRNDPPLTEFEKFIQDSADYPIFTPAYIKKAADFNRIPNRKFLVERVLKGPNAKKIIEEALGEETDYNDLTEEDLEKIMKSYMPSRLAGETDAMGNPIPDTLRGDRDENNFIPPIIPIETLPVEPEGGGDDQGIINYRLMADGGMTNDAPVYEGGIMDLESSRQMYGLGKLVKKITRGVKKIVKSPIGRAALMYFGGNALMNAGGGGGLSSFFGKKSFSPFLQMMGKEEGLGPSPFGELMGKLGLFDTTKLKMTGLGKTAMIGLPSILSGLITKKDEDDDQELYPGADIDDPKKIMANAAAGKFDYLNYRNAADGGLMRNNYAEGSEEPVAKKTMPLLDMDGQEMDLREEGGFVPLGRMERADDVPARLSKNEFVFTADAVRNAGEGDVDKGAEVMYNMMKNLESGGEVSEESQGLEGARKMFQTSQRLEEVI